MTMVFNFIFKNNEQFQHIQNLIGHVTPYIPWITNRNGVMVNGQVITERQASQQIFVVVCQYQKPLIN